MSSQITAPQPLKEDYHLEIALRPNSFDEYVGQEKIKANLRILIEAAKKRNEPIDHLLLSGASGLGKTTLAHIIAKEMRAQIKVTSGPTLERVGDLASILTNLKTGDILFCDEVHRLNKNIEEALYPAMENFVLDIVIGKGPSARIIQLELPHFTFIGATTRTGLISSPLRNRFGANYRLDFYGPTDIEKIIARSAEILQVKISQPEALRVIAQAARRTPRIANRLLKRVRDYCQVRGSGSIDKKGAQEALKMLEIDELGLEPGDRHLLETIITKFDGGPVGIQTLAAATHEEIDTIEEVYEPYLLSLGFLARTARGRIATPAAYEHLGFKYKKTTQEKLW